MALKFFVNIIVLISITNTFIIIEGAVPPVSFEVLRSGGFRAVISSENGNVTLFKLTANVNEKLSNRPAKISQETKVVTGDKLVLEFSNLLKVSDVINYRVFATVNRLGYILEKESFEVSELLDSYSPLTTQCIIATTIVNRRNVCIGDVIFTDSFNTPVINLNKWSFEHRIPTNSEPNYEFNSYQNIDETRFVKNGTLHLQPIALREDSDVRGSLNLTVGCTSNKENECFFQQASAFLLPPVKSAKMKSLVNFKYGRIEIQAKLPAGDWIVPVIQLQPSGDDIDFTKIWIAYSRGNNHLRGNNLNDDIGSRMIFAGPVIQNIEPERSEYLVSRKSIDPYYANFHTYTLEWLPGSMKFYFDSQLFGNIPTSSQFHGEYHLSLGVSVGGINDFPDGYISDTGAKPWLNTERNYIKNFFEKRNIWLETWNDDDSALKIDSVKILAI